MTPAYLKIARTSLGLSTDCLAVLLNAKSGKTVLRWETGDLAIPGPVGVLVEALMESKEVRQYFGVALNDDAYCFRRRNLQ